ncbi:hypothetical protein [Nitrosovibrio sp. Nv17]|uniref:hypothetical protein n=1 Tax=Nitrosovibrio sp. Nv17 TaxID=1855339 RepID=UPI0009085246|nr:hypothetical protein [Nitrosovibrio sp. Nv17]SFW31601.1 hypothetical protein SAMN05216414_11557 [Nitrosovibrio sp. Nv17]
MTDKQNPKDSPASPAPKTAADPQAAEAPQSRSLAANTRLSELTIDDLNSIISAEASKAIASRLANQGGLAGSHVNSGPPGFVNGGGHANFDPARNIGSRVNVGDAGRAGVHVNSGPPGFVNGGGHANFDPARNIGSRVNVGDAGRAGVHVNSGPPGFVNGGGHANFDPARNIGSRVNVGDLGRAGSHVNSGPPGFVNGGGHANFDPRTSTAAFINVTLPDGGQVAIPATGPVDLHVRGFHITR